MSSSSKFVDVKEDPQLERTSLCNITKDWMPPITDCVGRSSLAACCSYITYISDINEVLHPLKNMPWIKCGMDDLK